MQSYIPTYCRLRKREPLKALDYEGEKTMVIWSSHRPRLTTLRRDMEQTSRGKPTRKKKKKA